MNENSSPAGHNVKIIRSRYKQEMWVYDEPIGYNYQQKNKLIIRRTFAELNPDEKIKSLKKKRSQAQKQLWYIVRLVNANFSNRHYRNKVEYTDKFLTLTFNQPLKFANLKQTNHLFWLFINRLRRYLRNFYRAELKYLAAWEIQPHSKRVHYHIILFDFPYITFKKLTRLWGNGYIYIEKIDKVNKDRRGAYIAKYLAKNVDNYNPDYYKVKHFFKSQNIREPDERRYLVDTDGLDPQVQPGLVFSKEYQQSRYNQQANKFYQIRVRYYVYRGALDKRKEP